MCVREIEDRERFYDFLVFKIIFMNYIFFYIYLYGRLMGKKSKFILFFFLGFIFFEIKYLVLIFESRGLGIGFYKWRIGGK